MNVVRYGTPRAFLDAVEPFLLRDEACHNLLLGIPARLAARGSGAGAEVYLAAALDRDQVTAAAMMTPPFWPVLSQTTRPGAVSALAQDIARLRPAASGVGGPEAVVAEFVGLWRQLTGDESRRVLHERIHRLEAVRPLQHVPGRLRRAGDADRGLLLDWLRAFGAEAFGEDSGRPVGAETVLNERLGSPGEGFVLWDDHGPRCVAGYTGATRHGIRIGPVYTPPEHRGRGYGTACVAELSRQLLESGRRFCMLFTDLANATSNRIYQRIGYEPVCDVAEYRFDRSAKGGPSGP